MSSNIKAVHVTFSQKTKAESGNRFIKTCSLDLETYFKYFILLYFVLLKFPRKWCFVGQPKFSVMAQWKLKSAPALCAFDFLEMLLMLLTAPQGLKIHTINIFKYQIFLTGFRWAKIFGHGAQQKPQLWATLQNW